MIVSCLHDLYCMWGCCFFTNCTYLLWVSPGSIFCGVSVQNHVQDLLKELVKHVFENDHIPEAVYNAHLTTIE